MSRLRESREKLQEKFRKISASINETDEFITDLMRDELQTMQKNLGSGEEKLDIEVYWVYKWRLKANPIPSFELYKVLFQFTKWHFLSGYMIKASFCYGFFWYLKEVLAELLHLKSCLFSCANIWNHHYKIDIFVKEIYLIIFNQYR